MKVTYPVLSKSRNAGGKKLSINANIIAFSLEYYPVQYISDKNFKERRLSELKRNHESIKSQIDLIEKKVAGCSYPASFTDAEWLSAEKKRSIVTQWMNFVKSGFKPEKFTKAIYEHLHLHCGFIAHYNLRGFYHTYWDDEIITYAKQNSMLVRPVPAIFFNWESFLKQFCIWGEYTDINTAMMKTLLDEIAKLTEEVASELKTIYNHDIKNAYALFLDEREGIEQRIEEMTKEVQGLRSRLESLNPEGYLEEIKESYRKEYGDIIERDYFVEQTCVFVP
ncbi:MAG: hypothetical protein IBX72_08560 [Nitrospirae bacterium]|nr:hypothetical protein [Nitrospirota bacterium]